MSAPGAETIDGDTRLYGIIGDPIAQVRSPTVYNERFRRLGKNAVMIPLHATPAAFDSSMRGFKSLANVDGILVTIPFKSAAMNHVDVLLPAARRIGAMNALRREADGSWSGDMFDGRGSLAGLR
jgi:shikimate dehydrogenase